MSSATATAAVAGTVTLFDGTRAPIDSEAWRHECEARSVARMPGTEQRRAYIDAITRARGAAAADALRTLATRIRLKEILHRSDT